MVEFPTEITIYEYRMSVLATYTMLFETNVSLALVESLCDVSILKNELLNNPHSSKSQFIRL